MVTALIKDNIPFRPWDIYPGMHAEVKRAYEDHDVDDLPPVDTAALYEAFSIKYPFGGVKGPRNKGDAISIASSAANAKATELVYTNAFMNAGSSGPSGRPKSKEICSSRKESTARMSWPKLKGDLNVRPWRLSNAANQWKGPTPNSQGSWQMTSPPLASDRRTLTWTTMRLAQYQVCLHMRDF